MTTKTKTERWNLNDVGPFDKEVVTTQYFHEDGWLDMETVICSPDSSQNMSTQYLYVPFNTLAKHYGPGQIEWETEKVYDYSGKLGCEIVRSPDLDGDGTLGDRYSNTNFKYNVKGIMTSRVEQNYYYDELVANDYVKENWAINAKGQCTKYTLDDPSEYNNVITQYFTYDTKNHVTSIKEINQGRWGDKLLHLETQNTYNTNGTPKTKVEYNESTDQGVATKVVTAFSWTAAKDTQKISYYMDADSKVDAIKVIEFYKTDGQVTFEKVMHNTDAVGPYESRDVAYQVWDGDYLVSRTEDHNWNFVIDHEILFA